MSQGCGSCGSCDSACRAPGFINSEGYQAVKCPTCDTEIVIDGQGGHTCLSCQECGTIIEVVPVLMN